MVRQISSYSALVVAIILASHASRAVASITLNNNDYVVGQLTATGSTLGTAGASFRLDGSSAANKNWTSDQGGLLNWTNVKVGPALNSLTSVSNIVTSCLEVVQEISWGGTYTFQAKSLVGAPNPGGEIATHAQANLIQSLFQLAYPDVGAMSASAARIAAGAFQIALWKLEYDGASSNFATGRMRLTNAPTGDAATMMANAASLLNQLALLPTNNDPNGHPNVWALTNSGNQDQLYGIVVPAEPQTSPVPEPASLIVWSVLAGGTAGFAVAGKRRRATAGRWSHENRDAILAVIENATFRGR